MYAYIEVTLTTIVCDTTVKHTLIIEQLQRSLCLPIYNAKAILQLSQQP